MNSNTPILRPLPRRVGDSNPRFEPPSPPTPNNEFNESSSDSRSNGGLLPTRGSVMNLTASTLFGIFAPEGGASRGGDDLNTPWGPGAQTPRLSSTPDTRLSLDDKRPPVIGSYQKPQAPNYQTRNHLATTNNFFPILFRITLLFIFGLAYGMIVIYLHDNQGLAPVTVEGIDRWSWGYLMFWGLAGVGLGSLLPWVDILWGNMLEKYREKEDKKEEKDFWRSSESSSEDDDQRPSKAPGSSLGADWNPVVRSIGAFIGIAFAIRKLPWQSTLQVSLTLALVNPVLWYIIDRSKPGFILSTIVGLTGTAVLLGVNPDMVPSPSTLSHHLNVSYDESISEKLVTNESIGVGTFIASVLFCSCVCFGNIGRRLALSKLGTRENES
ncbi:MAG: hypothetical protein MMC33_000452 [Icmadophila ericetorum]|nr:hypothetical protein [Icmadophila ericetorum]